MGFLHENLHFLFMVLICLAGDGAWKWDGHSDIKLLVLLAKLFLVDCFYLSKVSAKPVQTTWGRQISKISTLFKIFQKEVHRDFEILFFCHDDKNVILQIVNCHNCQTRVQHSLISNLFIQTLLSCFSTRPCWLWLWLMGHWPFHQIDGR